MSPLSSETARKIADEVRDHPARAALGALAADVLSRQAEGRALLAGKEMIERRVAEHAVDPAQAETSLGSLVAILERGADSEATRALVVAFATAGLDDELRSMGEQARAERCARWVRHTDWLELATPYPSRAFVDALLSDHHAALVWSELAQAIVDEGAGLGGGEAPARARNAARLSAVAASSSPAARRAVESLVRTRGLDPPTLALARSLAPGPAGLRIRGRIVPARARPAWALVRWVTGWALASWAVRGLASLLGVRREAEIALDERGIEVREERFLLGRKVRESVSTLAPAAVKAAGREVRYPALPMLVGVVALSFGLLFGGLVLIDGARSGDLLLMLTGALLVLGGAGLDLAIDVLVPGSVGRVTLDLSTDQQTLRIGRVPLEQADEFLGALKQRASL